MTCWSWWPSFICSKPVLKLYGHGYWDGLWAWGSRWGRNEHPETHMWIAVVPLELEPKLHRCPAGQVHMEPLGLRAMEMLLIFETSSNFNCWGSLFSLSQQELQWETRDTQLGCYSSINPPWQGQWEIKIHCHFTQLSSPVQSRRNKRRNGIMFPIRSTSVSVYPDTQIKVQWEDWSEHELKEIPT